MKKTKAKNKNGAGTLLIAWLMSAPGPLLTGFAALSSRSATQIADFIRRTAELVASFSSWLIFIKITKKDDNNEYRRKLEKTASLIVALAMLCSGIALFIVGFARLFNNKANGNVIMGLIIASLGLVANLIFFLRYKSLEKTEHNIVLNAQKRLYKAKTLVDFCVVIALLAITLFPLHPAAKYADAFGSIGVSVYLVWNGIKMIKERKEDVLQA